MRNRVSDPFLWTHSGLLYTNSGHIHHLDGNYPPFLQSFLLPSILDPGNRTEKQDHSLANVPGLE